uniref:Uncharacterized protein n=1 Tax=Chromera velia CCMP2878 TaxID=1169474 RepID=A0A0G4HQA2_9ALVE|eukprot:Cvel_7913.t1-p1 / transcript=Cvel_7913.t1 / gene=Cvel_7913 / organism=Chromera_velia_CCMP2878 / gene_product=hypothetical protein / transcript_product=hypothetical protein / location=Cvel_scaffold424:50016-50828(-) / protein_length=248 / sequence_SO=supercontig / SO=protein_coding / is_pseudo=false
MHGRCDAADSLMDWIDYYGVVPKKILTDRAPELIGGKFIETCKSFSPPILPERAPTGIKGILGFAERPIRTHRNQVRVALDRCLVPSEGGRWGERIPHSLAHEINIAVAIEGDKIVHPTDRKSAYERRTGEKPDCKFALGDWVVIHHALLYYNAQKHRIQVLNTYPFLVEPLHDGPLAGWRMVKRILETPVKGRLVSGSENVLLPSASQLSGQNLPAAHPQGGGAPPQIGAIQGGQPLLKRTGGVQQV